MLPELLRRHLPPGLLWPSVAAEVGLVGAKLTAVRRTPLGVALELRLLAPLTVAAVEAAAPKVAVAFGVARCRVLGDEHRADRVTVALDIRQGVGPVAFPTDGRPLWLPLPVGHPVPLGLDDDGRLVTVQPVGSSVLVGGNPGAGKSSAVRVVLAGLVQQRHLALVGVDPKWAELGPWKARFSALVLGNDSEPVIALLTALNAEVQRRAHELARSGAALWQASAENPAVVLVVDEWAELAAAGVPKEQTEVARQLRRFVAMGRAVGCGVVLATQRPTSDSIDTTTKSLLNYRLALRCGDRYASEAILGPAQYAAASIPASSPGRGFLASGGDASGLQVFDLDHAAIPDLTTAALRCELAWLPDLD